MKKTNVQCIFVASGFPKNISHFLRKVNETEDQKSETDSCEEEDANDKLIQIENRAGNFIQSASRPKTPDGKEWKIIFAQFATCYQQYKDFSKVPKNVVWNGDMSEKDGMSIKNYLNNEPLPKYMRVYLSPKKHIFM